MFLDVIFFLVIFITSCCYSQSAERCTTPDNKQGECINVNRCPSLTSMLTQTLPVPGDVLDFFRKSQCGIEGTDLRVCCPTTINQPSEDSAPDVSNHPNLRLLPLNICGAYFDDKMITGTETRLFEHPWMAVIGYNRGGEEKLEFRCAGTIINEKYVLSAAHCFVHLQSSLTLARIRVGEHDTSKDPDCMEDENGEEVCADPPVDYDIEAVFAHPNYSRRTLQNDIALLRIRGRFNFRSDYVKPICLPVGIDQKRNLDGMRMLAFGWGTTEEGRGSNVLRKVEVPVVPLKECAVLYSQFDPKRLINITSSQICAGGEKGRDVCAGDTGGPLVYLGEHISRRRLVNFGIVSFGPQACGTGGIPSVYTRISHYMDWILSNMKPS